MSNFKTSIQNYIYKVEEIEENEEITCHTAQGNISTANRILPKVTRYFIRNDKGESQGYIERKFMQNFGTENSDEKESSNLKTDIVKRNFGSSGPRRQNKIKLDPQLTFKSGNKSNSNYKNPKNYYRSRESCNVRKDREIRDYTSIETTYNIESGNNCTLDYTSSNSTPSDFIYGINHLASPSDTMTSLGVRNEKKPTKVRICTKTLSTKISPSIFCKDPNRRLKNLFTIIKSSKVNDGTTYFPKSNDVQLLGKTKSILVELIDNELQRINFNYDNNGNVSKKKMQIATINNDALKVLKLECMKKIEDELRLLKRLGNC